MKVLVVTSEAISSEELKAALGGERDAEDAEVMVVAPALQPNALKFWLSDADDAITRAEEVRRRSVEQLGSDGVAASSDTGESDPMKAIEDALITFDADRIVMFVHGEGDRAYREDIDAEQVRERFGRPVELANVSGAGH